MTDTLAHTETNKVMAIGEIIDLPKNSAFRLLSEKVVRGGRMFALLLSKAQASSWFI